MNGFRIDDPILRRILLVLGVLAIIIAGFHTFKLLKDWLTMLLQVLSPFLAALLLAYLLAPMVSLLQRRLGVWRFIGAFILYLLITLVLLGALAYLIPVILTQLESLFQTVKEAIPALLSWLSERKYLGLDPETAAVVKQKFDTLHIDYNRIIEPFLNTFKNLASGGFLAAGELTANLVEAVGGAVDLIIFLVFVMVINFYLILDWHRIRPFLEKLTPHHLRHRTFETLDKIDTVVGGFLRGQFIVAAIVGASFAAGLTLIGFFGFTALQKYAVLIGTLAAVGGFIPYLGPIIGVTPAVLIVLFSGPDAWSSKIGALLLVVGLFAAIQTVEGWVLQPRIVGKGAGLHPLVVLLALVTGSQFGMGGIIIAVPVAGIVKVLALDFIAYRNDETSFAGDERP